MILSEGDCPVCRAECRRVPRKGWQRYRYKAIYECPACHVKLAICRHNLLWCSLRRQCPKCGDAVARAYGLSSIEKLYLNPISLIQALLFAPLWTCNQCRMSFFDLRPGPAPEVQSGDARSTGATGTSTVMPELLSLQRSLRETAREDRNSVDEAPQKPTTAN